LDCLNDEVEEENLTANTHESPERDCKMDEIQTNLTHYLKKKESIEDFDEEAKKDSPRDVNHPAYE